MIESSWELKKVDSSLVEILSKELDISEIAAKILINRGVTDVTDAKDFLNPDFFELHNPFLFPDMEKAVERIRKAMDKNEKILIYGDRDVDGVISICILLGMFKIFQINPLWYIPVKEGYGFHKSAIEKFPDVNLIITVDCGITDFDTVKFANRKNIDVIITDHHQPSQILPEALAVINPKANKDYPFQDLAGCAVAFKLAQAVMMSFEKRYNEEMIAIDIETTGLHPQFDEICEVAAVKFKNYKILETFYSLVKPTKPIPSHVSRIHGITDEMCKDAPPVRDVLKNLMNFIGERTIVVHNADFDISFIRYNLKKHLNCSLDNEVIDTLEMSRAFFPLRSHSLESLMRDLHLKGYHPHRALDDAMITIKIYEKLQKIKNVKLRYFVEENLDLVSIGTIADIMPLVDENRIIVRCGMDALRRTRKIGLGFLMDSLYNRKINSRTLTFEIAPLLNACGRLNMPEMTIKLFMSENTSEAERCFEKIKEINKMRKKRQSENIKKFYQFLNQQCDVKKDKIFVVVAEGVEHGVTGIVASQFLKIYNRPVILLILDNDIALGAGRSFENFNLYKALWSCQDLLLKFGGHACAVGLSITRQNIEEFRRRIMEIAEKEIREEDLRRKMVIDTETSLKELLSKKISRDMELLEPFGLGNPFPTFLLRNVKIDGIETFGTDSEHLRLKISQDSKSVFATLFHAMELKDYIINNQTKRFDFVVQVEEELWEEKEITKLQILDLKALEA